MYTINCSCQALPIQSIQEDSALRELHPNDLDQVSAVYRDAVISQTQGLYSPAQIAAWSDHAHTSNAVRDGGRQAPRCAWDAGLLSSLRMQAKA